MKRSLCDSFRKKVNPLTLHYQAYGNKSDPLIIFLHGGGVSSWMWEKQVQYLTDFYCVTVDLPEQGRSNDAGEFSIKGSAAQVIELIDTIKNDKSITVIGFSLGSQVLIQMLSMKPNLIDYAILNSALVRPSKIGTMLVSPLIRLSFPLVQNKTFAKAQAKTLHIGQEYFEQYYDETCQMKRQTLVRILQENMSFGIPPEFHKANAKILVTVGAKEKNIMKKSAYDLLNNNPNSTGIVISGIGHGFPLAEPELFNELITKWIHATDLPKAYTKMKPH